jgi:UDP-GlcNAc:undecaprenyl-phosphate/decaprenyl-phosphate GlcNAc-1-phosphate transferase
MSTLFVSKAVGLGLATLAVSWAGACAMLKRAGNGAPLDLPCARSSHQRPTVRGGGVGLAFALCLSLLLLASRAHGVPRGDVGLFAIATVIVAAIGLWDDYRNPPASWRLFLQLGAAGLVMGGGMEFHLLRLPWGHNVILYWAAAPLTLLWIAGMTNLYNFIDGVDGLASCLAITYSAGIAAASFAVGRPGEAVVALVIIAACLGFLWFNFPPARLFMGDVGSLTLGFVLSVLAIRLSSVGKQQIPLAFFLILFSSFLFDTSYTILRRAIRGERFWLAHRSHLYERLTRIGWSHLRVTLLYVGLSLVSICLAFGYLNSGPAGRTEIAVFQLLVCAGQLVFVKTLEGSGYALLKQRGNGEHGERVIKGESLGSGE